MPRTRGPTARRANPEDYAPLENFTAAIMVGPALGPSAPKLRPFGLLQGVAARLLRFMGQKRVAIDLKQTRLALTTRATEGVNRRAYFDVGETRFFHNPPPACARQATGNSIGTKVDVADRCFRHGLARRDIGK